MTLPDLLNTVERRRQDLLLVLDEGSAADRYAAFRALSNALGALEQHLKEETKGRAA